MQRDERGRFCRLLNGFKGYLFRDNKLVCKTGLSQLRYVPGRTYTKRKNIEKPELCSDEGYHFCEEAPMTWNYYPPMELTAYTLVEVPEKAHYTVGQDKCIATSLKIGDKILSYLQLAYSFFRRSHVETFGEGRREIRVACDEKSYAETDQFANVIGSQDLQCLRADEGDAVYFGGYGAAFSCKGFAVASSVGSLAQSMYSIAVSLGTAVSPYMAVGLETAASMSDAKCGVGAAIGGGHTKFIGDKGALFVCLYSLRSSRPEYAIARVGEKGIKPRTFYRWNGSEWEETED